MNVEEEESLEVRQRNEIQALQVGFKNKQIKYNMCWVCIINYFTFFFPGHFHK
jgi:hypothetical protein